MKENTNNQQGKVMYLSEQEDVAKRLADLLKEYLTKIDPGDTGSERYLGVDDAAEYLSCGPRRIYDLHSKRQLRCVKDGSRLLTRASWIDAYLEEVA